MTQAVVDELVLDGALTLATVNRHLADGRARLAKGPLCVDLSQVTDADSASLALLFDWLRTAKQHGHALSMRGLPAGMLSLAQLYGVSELLPAQA